MKPGAHTDTALAEWGFDAPEVARAEPTARSRTLDVRYVQLLTVISSSATTVWSSSSHRQLVEHLAEQVAQIGAIRHRVQVRLVELLRRLEVEAVVILVVEMVALTPPGVVKHLPPFGARVDADLDRSELQGTVPRLRLLGRRHDGPLLLSLIEDLLAVSRHIECIHAGEEVLHLPLLEIEPPDVDAFVIASEERGRGDPDEENSRLARGEALHVSVRDGQGQNALADAFEVDPNRLHLRFPGLILLPRLFLRLLAVLLIGVLILLLYLALRVLILRVLALVSLCLLLIALRSQRRGQVIAQHGRIDVARGHTVDAGEVRPAQTAADVGARSEVEILAAAIEHRVDDVAETVGDLRRFSRVNGIDEDRVDQIRQVAGVGDPAAVGRPPRLEHGVGETDRIGVDFDAHARRDVDVPEGQPPVGVRHLRAANFPLRRDACASALAAMH